MKTYERADKTTDGCVATVMAQYHPALVKERVRVGLLMVHPDVGVDGTPKSPALKFAGSGVTAKIAIASVRERLLANVDAVLQIDAWRWDTLSEEQQAALIDHELEHLEIKVDADGITERHEGGRPKLRTRPDDWVLTGFESVVERHGKNALEWQALRNVGEQLQFDFVAPKKNRKAG